ncbi:MAG: DUF3638 domain-containing protein [Simkaniaceae bacterium]|nr:MAG: DUF3638 domain-containing protein [Simkaniaceae bacterium]
MALRIAANFLSGGLSTGGSKPLDGMQPLDNFQVWQWVLENLPAEEVEGLPIDDLGKMIRVLHNQCEKEKELYLKFDPREFLQVVHDYTRAVSELKVGESYPLSGGWGNIGGGSGHALIFEVIRTSENRFNVSLYTSTGFQLTQLFLQGDKQRIIPIVCWEGIPQDHLFASFEEEAPPIFFQQLFELSYPISKYDPNKILEEEDVLEALDWLSPFYRKVNPKESGTYTGQRGGTCVPSSTKIWGESFFESIQDEKLFKVYFNWTLFLGLYQELSPFLDRDDEQAEIMRRTLLNGGRNLLGSLDKLVNNERMNSCFPIEKAYDIQHLLLKHIERIESLSAEVISRRQSESLPIDFKDQDVDVQREKRGAKRYWTEQPQCRELDPPDKSALPFLLTTSNQETVLKKALPALHRRYLEEKEREDKRVHCYQALSLSLHEVIDALPLPQFGEGPIDNSFWENLSLGEKKEYSGYLSDLCVFYLDQGEREDLPTRSFATLFSIHAIVHFLAIEIEKELRIEEKRSLTYYRLPFEVDQLNNINNLIFLDRKEFERIQQVKGYFAWRNKFAKGGVLFSSSEKESKVVKDSIHEALENAHLWHGLMQQDPLFGEAVKHRAEERFPDYSEEEIQRDFERQQSELNTWYEEQKNRRYSFHSYSRRPEPKRLKNLPLLTKQMLLLEEFDSSKGGNELLLEHYQHINHVRFLTFLINRKIYRPNYPSKDLTRKATRPDQYSHEGLVSGQYEKPTFDDRWVSSWERVVCEKYYHSLDREHRQFLEIPQATRKMDRWQRGTAEAQALNRKNFPPFLRDLSRTLSEWKLTPDQLFFELQRDYELLKNPSLQTLIYQLLFRSPVDENNQVHLGVGALILDRDVLESFKEFTEKALSYFSNLRHKQEAADLETSEVDGIKFLFELTFFMQKYLIDANRHDLAAELDFKGELDRWINDQTISRKPRGTLRLYRLLLNSLTPLEKIGDQTAATIYQDWIHFRLYYGERFNNPITPVSFHLIENFISKLLAFHHQSGKGLEEFCTPLINSLQMGEYEIKWRESPTFGYPVYEGQTVDQQPFCIDFRQGDVFFPEGKVKRMSLDRAWEKDLAFKRLFWGEKGFDYVQAGEGAVFFQHPKWGNFKILLKKHYGANHIQHQFEDGGEWYQYLPTNLEKEKELGLSPVLTKDHVLWAQVKVKEIVHRKPQGHGGQVMVFIRSMTGKTYTLQLDLSKSLLDQLSHLKEKIGGEQRYVRFILAGKVVGPKVPLSEQNIQRESTFHAIFCAQQQSGQAYDPNIIDLEAEEEIESLPIDAPLPQNQLPFKGIITSLKTQELCWLIDERGNLIQSNPEKPIPKERALAAYFLEGQKENREESRSFEGVTSFEDPQYILTLSNEGGEIKELHFPRFVSMEGNPLFLKKKKGVEGLFWNDNQQYRLQEKQKGCLGRFDGYLYLSSIKKEGVGKLFVPFRVSKNTSENEQEAPIEEWGSREYFDYDFDRGEVIARSVEAKWYLAYLYFEQKRYNEAARLIDAELPTDTISPKALSILLMIQKSAPPEDHPDTHAIYLRATYQYMEKLDKQSLEEIKLYFGVEEEDLNHLRNLIISAGDYLQSLSHLSESCRLSRKKEKKLLEKLIYEYEQKIALFDPHKVEKLKERITQIKSRIHKLQGENGAELIPLKEGKRELPRSNTKGRNRSCFQNVAFNLSLPERFYREDYENYVRRCKQEIELKTKWLEAGEIPFLVSYYPYNSRFTPYQNGALLLHVLSVAKKGSDIERRAMIWRLRNYRLHWIGDERAIPYLDLMINIACCPENFPDPIDTQETSHEEKKSFLEAVEKGYNFDFYGFESKINQHCFPPRSIQMNSREKKAYPLAGDSWYDPKKRKLRNFGKSPIPLPLTKAQYDDERFARLKDWNKRYFVPDPRQESEGKKKLDFSLAGELIHNQDEEYRAALAKDLGILAHDYEEGARQRAEDVPITISEESCPHFLRDLQEEKSKCSQELDEKEKEAFRIFNQMPIGVAERLSHISKLGARVANPLSLDIAREALLSGDQRAFLVKNPSLREEDIKYLTQCLIDIEDLKSWKKQLERMEERVIKLQKNGDPHNLTYKDHCKKLKEDLEAEYHFSHLPPKEQITFRIFCGETGMIPFKKQIDLILQMSETCEDDPSRFRDIVIQLIMGGGKTSVIATLLLQLTAMKKGHIALFMIPAPLFKSVSANLSTALKTAFNRSLKPINVKRSELTVYRLKQLVSLLEKSKDHPQAVIATPTSFQVFDLEFLSQSRKFKRIYHEIRVSQEEILELDGKDPERLAVLNERIQRLEAIGMEHRQKIELLAEIITASPDALMDEVDLILDCLLEVNFPDGEKIPINPKYNRLGHALYLQLIRDDLTIPTLPGKPSVLAVTQLLSNKQSIDPEKLTRHVFPVIARELYKQFAPFKQLPQDLSNSFVRYVTGKVPHYLSKFVNGSLEMNEQTLTHLNARWREDGTLEELRNDILFWRILNGYYESLHPHHQTLANLVNLTSHLFQDILSFTLNLHVNRDIGLIPGNPDGKLCPFDGVDSPAIDRDFGYVWGALCHYYQYASTSPPKKAQILQLARLATEAAHYYMKKSGEVFKETAEYLQFLDLTGVSLDEFQDPKSRRCKEALQQVKKNFKKDVHKRLALQEEVAAHLVKIQDSYLSCTGIDLCRRLKSKRTMAGLPWNVEGYPESLARNFIPDVGTEGKVIDAIVENVETIHKIDFVPDIEQMLEDIFAESPNPQKIRGAIDGGGLLKVCPNNRSIAKGMLRFLERKQKEGVVHKDIDCVLFFYKEPGEVKADTLYVWRMGVHEPEKVGGTTAADLEAKGLDPSRYFVLFNEDKTTGIDIPMASDAVCLFFFDTKMLMRTFGQGAMRLRKLLSSQNIEPVLDKRTLEVLFYQGEKPQHLVFHSAGIQSVRKTGNMVRYFHQQINSLFRGHSTDRLLFRAKNASSLEWDGKDFVDCVEKGEPYFVQTWDDNQLRVVGQPKEKVDTIPILQNKLKQTTREWEQVFGQDPLLSEEVSQLQDYLASAENILPARSEKTCDVIGMIGMQTEAEVEMEVTLEVNLQQEREQETEVDEEVELELQLYEQGDGLGYRPDLGITHEAFLELVKDLRSEKPQTRSLKQQLGRFRYGFQREQKHFEQIFSEPIFGTEAYFNTCKQTLNVFHPLQRPPKQILAIQISEDEVLWLLLSEREASDIRKYMREYKGNDMWLIQPDGSPLFKEEKLLPSLDLEEDHILEGLLEINAFHGNAEWLGKYENYFIPWLQEESSLKLDFLRLRTARDEHQRHILNCLPSLLQVTGQGQSPEQADNQILFSWRAKREKPVKGHYVSDSPEEVKRLKSRKKIEKLHPDLVPYLGDEADDNLSRRQMRYLQPYHIPHCIPRQIKWLAPKQVVHIRSSSQIYQEDESGPLYFLSKNQLKDLQDSQSELIPFVNPDYYIDFDQEWQIQAVLPKFLDRINPRFAYHFTETQIKEGILTLSDLEKYCQFLLPKHFNWISGSLLEGIPGNQIQKKHIEEIADSLIPRLEEVARSKNTQVKQWVEWLKPQKVSSLPDPLLQYITQDHVPELTLNQIQFMQVQGYWTLELIKGLQKEQIEQFESKELINLLTNAQIQSFLTDKQVSLLSEEKVNVCPAALMKYLIKTQVPSLGQEEINEMQKNPECHHCMEWVQGNQLKWITNPKAAKCITEDRMKILPMDQVNHFIPTHPLFHKIRGDQVNNFSFEQINAASKEHLASLTNPDLVQFVSFWKVYHLSADGLRNRTNIQNLTYQVAINILGYLSQALLWMRVYAVIGCQENLNRNVQRLEHWKHTYRPILS